MSSEPQYPLVEAIKQKCEGLGTVEQHQIVRDAIRQNLPMWDIDWIILQRAMEKLLGKSPWNYFVNYTRDGYHVFGLDQKPVDYLPGDHSVLHFLEPVPSTRHPDPENPLPTVDHVFYVHCPLCGAASKTSQYDNYPTALDLIMVSCPRHLRSRKIWIEAYNIIQIGTRDEPALAPP